MDFVEPVGDDLVSPHREVDPRGGENRGVRRGGGRQQRPERHHRRGRAGDRGREGDFGGLRDGRVEIEFGPRDDSEHERNENCVDHADDQDAADDGDRQVSAGVFHLLADRCDLRVAEIRHEDEPGRRQDLRGSERRHATGSRDRSPIEGEPADDREDGQDPEQDRDDHRLDAAGLFRADVVDADEKRAGEDRSDLNAVQKEDRGEFEQFAEILAEPDDVKRGGEREPEPVAEPGDRTEHRAERAVDKVVRAPGFRHRGPELRNRQGVKQRDEATDRKGDDDDRAGSLGGDSGENEDPGPDHRPDSDRHRRDETEVLGEFFVVAHVAPSV